MDDPILNFLVHDSLPGDTAEAKTVRRQAASYTIVGGEDFRRGFSSPLLKCLDHKQANYVLSELHKEICGMHLGARSMAAQVLRAGYYWPTIRQESRTYIQKCLACQKHGTVFAAPPEEIHQTVPAWPFSRWGMDIL